MGDWLMVALDADDTLWHTEPLYGAAQRRFEALFAATHSPEVVAARLAEIEARNLSTYGYGAKGFALSLLETALTLRDGALSGAEVRAVLDIAQELLTAPVTLLDGVAETVAQLAQRYPLMIITRGDPVEQERKLTESGLAPYVRTMEVLTHKSAATYARVLARYAIPPERFVMVGNSLRSDVLPVLELGGWAVHVPYPLVWGHEEAAEPVGAARYARLPRLPELVGWLESG